MAVFDPKKSINKSILNNGEEAMVTLSFKATAELINKPADIVLLFDRSDSMKGERFEYARDGALQFVDHIVKACGGVNSLKNNTRLSLISFGYDATIDSDLTYNSNLIKTKIRSIVIPDYSKTNHAEAFRLAGTVLPVVKTKDQIVVMFTDGETTIGEEPNTYVRRLKDRGIEIFCIGLVNKDTSLRSWSSLPLREHMLSTRNPNKLIDMFNKISYEVGKSGAKDVVINEKINSNFEIINVNNPNFGKVVLQNNQLFLWTIDAFGIDEEAICTFNIKNISKLNEKVNVNDILTYRDRDNNILEFPNPQILLKYDEPIIPSAGEKFKINGCNDSIQYKMLDQELSGLGRIIQIDIPINNVCPNKRLAVAIILTEVDENNIEHIRGTKSLLINPINSNKCENILIKCVNFVIPELLDVSGNINTICNNRNFKARTLINYIDTNFKCCDINTVIIK